jgi:putative flippase GtrA
MVTGRYLAVGLACALLHNAIVIAGDSAGVHYAVSTLFSFAIVVVLGYRLHSGWTFPGTSRSGMSFARYAAMASANYPLSVAGMFVFVDRLGLTVPVASPIVTVLLTALNFFGNRWALRAGRSPAERI